jgi:hypothetical protein
MEFALEITSRDLECCELLSYCSKDLLEKLIVAQLVKKFPIFYGSRKFITVFTRAGHWRLS